MVKNSLHTAYKIGGTKVPSVTTVIGNLGWNRESLLRWTRQQASQGIDPDKVKDEAASIGTLTHKMVEDHINKAETNLFMYSPSDVERAMVGYKAFLDWETANNPVYVSSEIKLVSSEFNYGGTVDLIVDLNGVRGILDLKTSKGVYPEYIIQLSAYKRLYEENVGPVSFCSILKLDKESGSFEYHTLSEDKLNAAFEAFLYCRRLHDLKGLI